jgi:NAD(P)-dependent dehydrogenase (short-subunit alcohol dehydrogenase family)
MGLGDLGRFVGAAVIITGRGHGIGRACAIRLAEEGARGAVADLDQTAAQQVAADLDHGNRRHAAVWYPLGRVGEPEDVAAAGSDNSAPCPP